MGVVYYRELKVWQKAMDLAKEVYRITFKLPKNETYALANQMQRAAVSIASNIAEGQSRNSTKEFVNFLSIARGSKAELETQLLLCREIGYLADTDIETAMGLLAEISKMIASITKALKHTVTQYIS
ncbi:four helix bundle protein [Clostridia bacterium]|nr:four helix bundle protein [Clostridia bacterium]